MHRHELIRTSIAGNYLLHKDCSLWTILRNALNDIVYDLGVSMCYSIRLNGDIARLEGHFALSVGGQSAVLERETDFFAGSSLPVIDWNSHGLAKIQIARFGFRAGVDRLPITSFRSERIDLSNPSRAFREGRCIVPADSYVERADRSANSGLFRYNAQDGSMLGLAGLLRPEAGGLAVTLLTIESSSIGSHRGRKTAILDKDDYEIWLDDSSDWTRAYKLLNPAKHVPIAISDSTDQKSESASFDATKSSKRLSQIASILELPKSFFLESIRQNSPDISASLNIQMLIDHFDHTEPRLAQKLKELATEIFRRNRFH